MPGRQTTTETNATNGQILDRLRSPGSLDLLVAIGLVFIAAVAALALPEGNLARLVLTLPVLFFAPGYLLIQAVVGGMPPVPARLRHGLLAIGASPAIVGLAALATSLVPGGFQVTPIILTVVVVSLLIGLLALYRRGATPRAEVASAPRSTRA